MILLPLCTHSKDITVAYSWFCQYDHVLSLPSSISVCFSVSAPVGAGTGNSAGESVSLREGIQTTTGVEQSHHLPSLLCFGNRPRGGRKRASKWWKRDWGVDESISFHGVTINQERRTLSPPFPNFRGIINTANLYGGGKRVISQKAKED